MIISHKNHFIFIKTPKTAGTSIEIALSQYCGENDVITKLRHEEESLRASLGFPGPQNFKLPMGLKQLKIWERLSVGKGIKVKSNQHEKAKSIHKFVGNKTWTDYFKFCFERNPFDRAISLYYWHTRKLANPPTLNEYVQAQDQLKLSNWSFYTINDRVVVDFIGKYESLVGDLYSVTQRIGIPEFTLPQTKNTSRIDRTHYSQVLDPKSRFHIEKMCAKEIELLNYNWVDSNYGDKG